MSPSKGGSAALSFNFYLSRIFVGLFTPPLGLLGDIKVLSEDSVAFSARQVHSLRQMHRSLRNTFGRTCWYSQLKRLKWKVDRCKIGARFAPNAPQAQKPLWKHPMVLLGEEAQVKARYNLFGDSANLDAKQVHGLHGMYHMLGNTFGCNRQNSQMTCVIWNLASVRLEIILVLVQDRCTVCA